MPIKSDEASPQATTPIQQLQEADIRKENIENIDQRNTTNNRPTLIGTDNKPSTMQTGSAAMNNGTNGLHNASSNGQQHHNGTVAHQNGDSSHNYNNKHSLTSDNNDDSLLDTSAEFPPTKRQRTMPGSTFLGLGGDNQSSVPVLMSEVKVIDPNDSSLHNSSSSNFSQMNTTTTLLTSTNFAQQATTIDACQSQAQTDNTSSTSASHLATADDEISQQSQANDIEMMEAEMTAHTYPTEANNTIDMDDLSDIARAVTEQIVTRVSSYHGI